MKIKALPWLAGKPCGLCGKFDAETEQEFRTPTGYLAQNALSFAQSWVAPSDGRHTPIHIFYYHQESSLKSLNPFKI